MKRKDLEAALRSAGWILVRRGNRHDVWRRGELEVTVPRHREINEMTAKSILKTGEKRQP